jgi:NADH dehydrogenase FAD-containing subunit
VVIVGGSFAGLTVA